MIKEILGIIGTVAGTLGAIVTIPMGISPVWYPIALAVLAPPCVWLGGNLRTGLGRKADHVDGYERRAVS